MLKLSMYIQKRLLNSTIFFLIVEENIKTIKEKDEVIEENIKTIREDKVK